MNKLWGPYVGALFLTAGCGSETPEQAKQALDVGDQHVAVAQDNSPPAQAREGAPSALPFESKSCPLPDKFRGYTAESWCRDKGYKERGASMPYISACEGYARRANDNVTVSMIRYARVCSPKPHKPDGCEKAVCKDVLQGLAGG